jgi:hypothetical protein
MKKKVLFIIGGILLAIISLIIGLAIAGVDVLGALTSTTAILIYSVVTILGLVFLFGKFTKGWK